MTCIVEGLDRAGIDTDDQHRLLADVVGAVIAGLGNFVEPRRTRPAALVRDADFYYRGVSPTRY